MSDPYRDEVERAAPRVLSMLDRDPVSPTRGCFDRRFWAWKFSDFPAPRAQEGVFVLTWLWQHVPAYRDPRVLGWIQDALRFWMGLQHPDGSFDEAWPYERSLAGTAFSSFYVAESVDRLGEALDPALRTDVRRALRRAGDWLVREVEPHAVITNHLAAAEAAIAAIGDLTGPLSSRLEQRILRHLSPEGWFEEYGGADPGYQTHALFYLANLARRRPSAVLDRALVDAAEFVSWFVHPSGGLGGLYASRNTTFLSPAPFEALGDRVPAAAAIARTARRFGAVSARMMDEPNLFPLLASTALASEWRCRADGVLPCEVHGTRWFPQAGLFVASTPVYFAVVGTRKGVVDVESRDGRRFVSAGYVQGGCSSQFDGRSAGPRGDVLAMSTRFRPRRADVWTPAKFAAFRGVNLSVGRSRQLGRLLKRVVVRQLVTGRGATAGELLREVRFGEHTIEISDRFPRGARAEEPFVSIHMGSARYFDPRELLPAPEVEVVEDAPGLRSVRVRLR